MSATDARIRRVLSVLSFIAGFAVVRTAAAYCVATTCDPKTEDCVTQNGCVIDGAPLHWSSKCISFGTQQDGSKRTGVSYSEASRIIEGAFSQWFEADCGNHLTPSFRVWDLGKIECAVPEFNPTMPNANVVMFRDEDWPYQDENSTLALTSTVFDKKSGALLDADIEINSHAVDLSTSSMPGNVKKDLASIITHEVGHFLGLGHSQVLQATMYAQYVAGDLNYRSLHKDDEQGICFLYPPDRDVPECRTPSPPHGFTRVCSNETDGDPPKAGCSCRAFSRPDAGASSAPLGAVVCALLWRRFGRRRR